MSSTTQALATDITASDTATTEATTTLAISDDDNNVLPKTDVHAKYYQQALYYYFQGNYSGALAIINQSKSRLNTLEPMAQLFEAGLQIKIGLQEEARQNLILLSAKQAKTYSPLEKDVIFDNQIAAKAYKVSSDQLLVIVLLSLADQYIQQNDLVLAQQTLAKISNVPTGYYQQYHVLSQLAYWPEQPDLLQPSILSNVSIVSGAKSSSNSKAQSKEYDVLEPSPYIQLNNALRFIEAEAFEQAINVLERLKNRPLQEHEQSFFQSLFSEEKPLKLDKQQEEEIQKQAIIDYARLLLAHLYTQQEAYEKVYGELKTFPQESNYTESALFLYAFSAQKIKQHTTALTLLTLLHEQYPHSALGWQASLLMAKQVTEQKGLAQGWKSYQNVESFYLNTIEQLNVFEQSFEQSFAESSDLLIFSTAKPSVKDTRQQNVKALLEADFVTSVKAYEPQSIWLKQAILDPSLNSLYQQLTEVTALLQHSQLLQRKSDWIVNVIQLNTKRKTRIAASQQALAQQKFYKNLLDKRENLASKLAKALNDPQHQGYVFANEEELAWLERLNQSKERLSTIFNDSDFKYSDEKEQATNNGYQQRLKRLNGVLVWRLTQAFPQRAWDHKQQLGELDHNLQQLGILQINVAQLLAESASEQGESSLEPFIKRQKIEEAKIEPLISKLETLKERISLKIREKVTYYSNTQRSILAQHVLTTRKAMASVLENMSVNDNKIEKQLNPEAEVNKQRVSTEPAIKTQTLNEQAVKESTIKVQVPNGQTSKEQAIEVQRMKLKAIRALRKALGKKDPASNENNIKNKSLAEQVNKGQIL